MGGYSSRSTTALFDAVADEYDATGTTFFAPMGARLVAIAGLTLGDRVLDVGTGRGAVLLPAQSAVGPSGRVIGVDLSPRMASLADAEARNRCGSGGAPAAVVVGDAAEPPVTGPFDAVVGGMVAQFLPSPGRALERWKSLTDPGGRLALSWWAAEDERYERLHAIVARHLPRREKTGVSAFSEDVEVTETLLREHGWTDVRTSVEQQLVEFRDVAAWWRWSWSHGQRRRWESVPDLAVLEVEVNEELALLAEPNGRLLYRPQAAFTVARLRGARRSRYRSGATGD